MCFSVEANLVAGAVVAPLGVLALREVRDDPAALPLASLPVLFAAHQVTEALVWAGADGTLPQQLADRAAVAYVWFALPVLPLLVPIAVSLVARPDRARWCWPFALLGAVVAVVMGSAVADGIRTSAHDHAIVYHVGLDRPTLWTVLYVVATMGGPLLSGHRWLVAFGLANLVGLTAVALAYVEAFASLWCLHAALSSVLVLVHLVDRRASRSAAERPGLTPPASRRSVRG